MPQFTKTRIAPTPSGYLHLGNALSFITTAKLARQTGAKLLLRIDDIDKQRVTDAYLQDVFDTLGFLQIKCDEGPRDVSEVKSEWSQYCRLNLYSNILERLKQQDVVYACNCSRRGIADCNCIELKIPLDQPNVNWRLHTDDTLRIPIKTLEQGIIEAQLPADMKDFIVRKKDGCPAYQLTSVVDDLHFGVDLVVRGEDLWHSTIAQIYLVDVLGYDDFKNITFHHHSLLTDKDGTKLSKSAGATSIKYLREHGYTLEDIYKELTM
ncbi:MAG: tRNA glutamyl-Q synthetase [Sphingobacteriaceae bacterium]|nr:MAG: tRNA glutamyl-Q synthetase [Sphingobacteriaceae bacterium]